MSPLLAFASLAITGALILYTAGVMRERRLCRLDARATALFWLGLACDTTGTTLMSLLARTSSQPAPAIHGITGAAAILLMLFHAGWAAIVLWQARRGASDASSREQAFHRFSTVVWLLWLIPYIIGLLVGMPMLHLRAVCATGTSAAIVAVIAVFALGKAKVPNGRITR